MTDISEAFCWWPNGTLARNTTSGEYALPCDTGLNVSSCCLPGQTCNTQFRCLDFQGNFTQASCTQKDFNNQNCPCPNQIAGKDATTGCSDGTLCCGVRNSSCCAKGLGRLSLLYDYADAIPTATSDIVSYLSGYTPTTTATNTASSASKSDTSTTSDVTSTPTGASSTESKTDSPGGLSRGARIGIGVGIALVAVATILLVVWFFMRKRNEAGKSKVKTQGQRLDENEYEGDTWFRNEVEGDAHHPSQKPIEMEHQTANNQAIPIDTTVVSPTKSELEGHYSPYRHSPGGDRFDGGGKPVTEVEALRARLKELESPQARPNELESPQLRPNELESPQAQRMELESPQARRMELESPQAQRMELESPQSRPRELGQPSGPPNRRTTIRHELE